MMKANRTSQGFTLLELLTAMSLMVVAAACLYSSLSIAFRAKQVAERTLRPMERAQAAMELIMQDLTGAAEPNTPLTGHFVGTNDHSGGGLPMDSVSFCSTNHQIGSDSDRMTCGIGLIELELVEPKANFTNSRLQAFSAYNLVRRVTDNVLSEDATVDAEEILCRHVRTLNLRYYDGQSWEDQWDSSDTLDTLPVAVEVTLELEPQPEDLPKGVTPGNRMDPRYLQAITRLTQVFTLPCGVPLADVEAAASAASSTSGNSNSGGQG